MTDSTDNTAQAFIKPPQVPARAVTATYAATGGRVFWLTLWSTLLTFVTLGIYRFWMVTKLRRHYWAGIKIFGDPLEYSGKPVEKLLGFLLAIVVLSIYLGIVNLLLTFLGLAIVSDDDVTGTIALYLSALASLPLVFYGQYLGMTYLLSRTRWRGIRFGMVKGAWGYVGRALLLTILSIVTLGLAYPYQHYVLSKYMTDRSRFGDLAFAQGGSWSQLYKPWLLFYLTIAVVVLMLYMTSSSATDAPNPVVVVVGMLLIYAMFFRYYLKSFQILWSNRRLGAVEFQSRFNPASGLMTMALGVVVITVAMIVIVGILFGIGAAALMGANNGDLPFGGTEEEVLTRSVMMMLDNSAAVLGVILGYLAGIAIFAALSQLFFTHMILRMKVNTMVLSNPASLVTAHQRDHNMANEAGGFADALGVDVGI